MVVLIDTHILPSLFSQQFNGGVYNSSNPCNQAHADYFSSNLCQDHNPWIRFCSNEMRTESTKQLISNIAYSPAAFFRFSDQNLRERVGVTTSPALLKGLGTDRFRFWRYCSFGNDVLKQALTFSPFPNAMSQHPPLNLGCSPFYPLDQVALDVKPIGKNSKGFEIILDLIKQ